MYRKFLKRCLSLLLSIVALLAVGWLIGLVALILHFANKGAGVFFLQPRPGKDAKIFKVIKFKTMTDERDADGKLLPDAQRLTRIGKIVRSLSLDELPQLVNILKGDMAFIGPRPCAGAAGRGGRRGVPGFRPCFVYQRPDPWRGWLRIDLSAYVFRPE